MMKTIADNSHISVSGIAESLSIANDLAYQSFMYKTDKRVNDDYDFDVEYTSSTIEIKIYPTTKTETYTIGIAWIDDVGLYDDGDERDVQTWFGADPTLSLGNMKKEQEQTDTLGLHNAHLSPNRA